MNGVELVKTAEKYAGKIQKEYKILSVLDYKERKSSPTYLRHFEKLKEYVTLENMFYSILDDGHLDFFLTWFKDDPECYKSMDFLEVILTDISEEEFLKTRVYLHVLKEKERRRDASLEQVGMIPLFVKPYKDVMLPDLWLAAFHAKLSYKVLYDKGYPKEVQTFFQYKTSYVDFYTEDYYLQNGFQVDENLVKDAQIMTEEYTFKGQDELFVKECFDFFEVMFNETLECAFQYKDSDLIHPEMMYTVLIIRDAFASLCDILPYYTVLQFYEIFLSKGRQDVVASLLEIPFHTALTEKELQYQEKKKGLSY